MNLKNNFLKDDQLKHNMVKGQFSSTAFLIFENFSRVDVIFTTHQYNPVSSLF